MAHVYLVWKNSNCNGVNPQWIQMGGRQFYEFLQNEGKDRFFITIDDGVDQGMDMITLESTKEKYLVWHNEHEKSRQKRERQEPYIPAFVSMDSVVGDDNELTYHDVLADESVNVEEEAITFLMCQEVTRLVGLLPEDEKQIILALYYYNDRLASDMVIAKQLGMSNVSLCRKKRKILEKLKKSMK